MADREKQIQSNDKPIPSAGDELTEHCMIFHEVYEEDLKMIQAYLDEIDILYKARYQSAYSHWRKLLAEIREGTDLITQHHELNNPSAFHEALRAFSFMSAVRFLRDIGTICGAKFDKEWAERFQANIILILQAQQYHGNQGTSS